MKKKKKQQCENNFPAVSKRTHAFVVSAEAAYLIILAHGTTRGWVLGLDLLSRHPLPGVVAGGQRPGSVGCRVLALLAGELAVWSILLPPVVRLRLRKTFNNEEEKFKKMFF